MHENDIIEILTFSGVVSAILKNKQARVITIALTIKGKKKFCQ